MGSTRQRLEYLTNDNRISSIGVLGDFYVRHMIFVIRSDILPILVWSSDNELQLSLYILQLLFYTVVFPTVKQIPTILKIKEEG